VEEFTNQADSWLIRGSKSKAGMRTMRTMAHGSAVRSRGVMARLTVRSSQWR
jgi:hypothetical protein